MFESLQKWLGTRERTHFSWLIFSLRINIVSHRLSLSHLFSHFCYTLPDKATQTLIPFLGPSLFKSFVAFPFQFPSNHFPPSNLPFTTTIYFCFKHLTVLEFPFVWKFWNKPVSIFIKIFQCSIQKLFDLEFTFCVFSKANVKLYVLFWKVSVYVRCWKSCIQT